MNVIVKFIRMTLNVSIALVLTFGSSVKAVDLAELDHSTGSLRVASVDPTVPALNVQFETKIIEPGETSAELAAALETSAETVIVSSDESDVLAQAASEANSKTSGHVFLLPIGKAIRKSADLAGGANQLLRNSGLYLTNAFKKDKIGFSIATFTLSNEIVRWVHVSTASNFVITSNIIYTILWSALFVDKDTWSKTTKPIQKTYRRLFGLSNVIPDGPTGQDMAIKFLAGLSLSMMLNSVRASLVGVDQLAHHVFDPLTLSMPFVMGAVMTAVGFSWSELLGSVNEARFPRSKKILRLVMNSRSCLISYFAASAMLMNPEHYGVMPWIAVSISGVTGLVLYSNVKRVLPLLEGRSRGLTCESAFSPAGF